MKDLILEISPVVKEHMECIIQTHKMYEELMLQAVGIPSDKQAEK